MERTKEEELSRELQINFRGLGTVKTKQHGEIKAKLYKSYVEFATLLKHLSNNTLGVEIKYSYPNDDLLKIIIENALKKEIKEKDFDYSTNEQNTLENMFAIHTIKDLDLTFTYDIV